MTDTDVPENPHAGQGMVVLDIGGDVGALIVSAPAELVGAEIEICPSGARDATPDEGGEWWVGEWRSHGHSHDQQTGSDHDHDHDHGAAWPHVAVLERPSPAGRVHAAVFPGLRTGRYDLWVRPAGAVALTAEVLGGEVTSADWPPSP